MPMPPTFRNRLDADEIYIGGSVIAATATELSKLSGAGAVVASGTQGGTVAHAEKIGVVRTDLLRRRYALDAGLCRALSDALLLLRRPPTPH